MDMNCIAAIWVVSLVAAAMLLGYVLCCIVHRIKINDWIDVLCFILVLVILCIAPGMDKYFN